jgi:hypothetical protein
MVKFKDIFNQKINSNNKQIGFDVRKRVLKENDLTIEDIMDIELTKKLNKFKKQ